MGDDKIIDIKAYQNILNTDDKGENTADLVLYSLLEIAAREGHNIKDEEFIRDIRIVHLLFTASLNRLEGIEDANIEILDNCSNRGEI